MKKLLFCLLKWLLLLYLIFIVWRLIFPIQIQITPAHKPLNHSYTFEEIKDSFEKVSKLNRPANLIITDENNNVKEVFMYRITNNRTHNIHLRFDKKQRIRHRLAFIENHLAYLDIAYFGKYFPKKNIDHMNIYEFNSSST